MGRIRLFVCILLLLAVTTAVFAEGYVVILKSGHKIRCREPMRIEDSNAGTDLLGPLKFIWVSSARLRVIRIKSFDIWFSIVANRNIHS